MSSTEAQDHGLTATDLLAYNGEQLVQYLERNGSDDGGFDISSLVGMEKLPKSHRKELAERLR